MSDALAGTEFIAVTSEAVLDRTGVDRAVLGWWLFIASEAVLFSALIASYGYLRLSSEAWPRPLRVSPDLLIAAFQTACLLGASIAAHLASRMGATRSPSSARVLATGALFAGLLFLGAQIYEWHLVAPDVSQLAKQMVVTPSAATAGYIAMPFGATFLAITAVHLAHVIGGLALPGLVIAGAREKRPALLKLNRNYWDFLLMTWLVIFVAIYWPSMAPGG